MRKNSISLYDWCIENNKENILEEWDYKNNDFSPKEVSRASKIKAKWVCKSCGNEYSMIIQNRTLNNAKCNKCAISEAHEKVAKRRVENNGSLAELRPDILQKWNFKKNIGISPYDVSPKSTKLVWWICPTCGREFQSKICEVRTGDRCRICKGNKYVNIGRDNKYSVYCHISPDGKKYVGFTGIPLKTRFGNGKHYSKNSKIGRAIEKYGWDNFQHVILESGLSKEEASQKEEYYIKMYNTMDDRFGYNIATGGIHGKIYGRVLSDETKKKISISNTGKNKRQGIINKLSDTNIAKKNHIKELL